MNRRLYLRAALPLALMLAGACGPVITGPARRIVPPDSVLYRESIDSVAVYQPRHVRRLLAVPDSVESVRVAVFTNWAGYHADSTLTLSQDVWVTLVPEVRDSCLHFAEQGEDVTRRLAQLLGLPPATGYDRFAELEVRAADLFRPAPDPAITTATPCDSLAVCGFPARADTAHRAWFAATVVKSWRIPGGYPWTRLGYTYNWHPGSGRYGASEYVVARGSTVKVRAVIPTRHYCDVGAGADPPRPGPRPTGGSGGEARP